MSDITGIFVYLTALVPFAKSLWVLLSMSRRFIFGSSAIRVWVRVRSPLLSDLSYFPDLALTLMSARMRGEKAHARSSTSSRDSEMKLTAYTYR